MEAEGSDKYGEMLTVQHRMPETLMSFPSAQFYGGKLTAHAQVAHRRLQDLLLETHPLLCGEKALDESRENPGHGQWVIRLVEALLKTGLSPSQIGVITPYKAQVAWLHHRLTELILKGLEVDSVDAFQGREKSVIIFDTVRSNSEGQVGFLADERRVNVAMTRAQHQLILLGDSATLSQNPTWSRFFDHAMGQEAYRSVFELASIQEFV